MPSSAEFKAIKNALGGTVNDVVLTVVAGALGRYMRLHGHPTDGVELKAMVPVSVRADMERGALGNRVAAMWAPLPVGVTDPVQRLAEIRRAMDGIKDSGQAVGAQVLTELSGFAPPTIMAQAARLQARQRLFNLVVTNVPGPQFPLYVLGRELEAIYPMVPLAENTALGIAIMSYNGQLNFGLTADYDALADVETLADELRSSIDELLAAAGSPRQQPTDGGTACHAQAPCAGGRVKLAGTALERIAIVVASLILSVGLIAVLSGFFQNHDPAGVSGSGAVAGQQFPDLGHAHLSPGELRPPYNSDPPTSGAHVPEPVLRDDSTITNDQLLEALEVGDIVIMYGTRQPPPGLRAAR